jgi:hypothetical protein
MVEQERVRKAEAGQGNLRQCATCGTWINVDLEIPIVEKIKIEALKKGRARITKCTSCFAGANFCIENLGGSIVDYTV